MAPEYYYNTVGDESYPMANQVLHYCSIVATGITVSTMALVCFVMCTEFVKHQSPLKSPYYYLIAFGCGLDVTAGLAFLWTNDRKPEPGLDLAFENYFDWYYHYAVPFWNTFLALNRASAIGLPWKHQNFWNRTQLISVFLIIGLFPFVIRFAAYSNDIKCRFNQRLPDCLVFHIRDREVIIFLALFHAIFSFSVIVAALTVARWKKYRIEHKTEKSLLIQAILASSFLLGYAICQYVAAIFHECGASYVCNQFELTSNILFAGYHLPVIHALFFVREMVVEIDEITREKLLKAAFVATKRAYCPYSNFQVGAALLTESGEIVTGGNVENASYGGTICAERSAVVRAIAEGHSKFKAIAIATHAPTPATPCGICRQFMFEFGDMPVFLATSKTNEIEATSIKNLLPGGFGPNSLDEFNKSR